MKNYLVFIGEVYYASGGMEDFTIDFDTLEEATAFVESKKLEDSKWFHIYSLTERKIVLEEGSAYT